MPIVNLVRHGRAAAGFEGHLDPGLDAVGRSQAEAAAVALAQEFKTPVPIYTSPLARARDTAAPLAERWGSRRSSSRGWARSSRRQRICSNAPAGCAA